MAFTKLCSRERIAAVVLAFFGPALGRTLDAGVHGQFDYPAEAYAVLVTESSPTPSQPVVMDVTIPVSFRMTRGNPKEVEQIEVEVTFGDAPLQIVDYEPRTSLASDVVGEIEEKITMEDSRNWGGSVAASIPIPGLKAAQIGPSANISDSERVVRTETLRRRPQMDAVIVAGTAARGKGVFFQLRPGSEVTLEGGHHFTLRIAAPPDLLMSELTVRCRAIATEDWILFDRKTVIAGSTGKVKLIVGVREDSGDHPPAHAAAVDLGATARGPNQDPPRSRPYKAAAFGTRSLHHLERPCPWCDEEE